MKRVLLLTALAISACSTAPDRATVLNGLIGQDETAAVHALGVPSRTYDTPGHHFLAYAEDNLDYIPGGPFFGGYGFGPGYGYGFGGLGFSTFPDVVIDRRCETTLDVVAGRVQSWSLRGNACGSA